MDLSIVFPMFWGREKKEVDGYEGVSWDMYYLYGPDAVWETIPAPLIGSGGTVYREREVLRTEVGALLGK